VPAVASAALVAAVAAGAAVAPAAPFAWDRLKRLAFLAALYTRIAKERLLDHGSRDRLLTVIRERPGLPVTDLADAAGVPRNTATYHLRRLEREGLAVSQRSGRVRVWFVPGGLARKDEASAFAALRHDTTRAIAMEVAAQPGLDQQALCARFGLAPSLAHWHADRLVQSGLVRKERDGRHVRYYPTEGLPRLATLSN
jgi:predicted transcriptional regulator